MKFLMKVKSIEKREKEDDKEEKTKFVLTAENEKTEDKLTFTSLTDLHDHFEIGGEVVVSADTSQTKMVPIKKK